MPEDPQSEVTPLTVPANARSKLTERLGGSLGRGGPTFGALALVRAAVCRTVAHCAGAAHPCSPYLLAWWLAVAVL